MPRKRTYTTDALAIIDRRLYRDNPVRQAALEHERLNAGIAREIYQLRTKAGLTQQALATLVGTSHSAISRLEDADYQGHSLAMLVRITLALHHRLDLRVVPLTRKKTKVAG